MSAHLDGASARTATWSRSRVRRRSSSWHGCARIHRGSSASAPARVGRGQLRATHFGWPGAVSSGRPRARAAAVGSRPLTLARRPSALAQFAGCRDGRRCVGPRGRRDQRRAPACTRAAPARAPGADGDPDSPGIPRGWTRGTRVDSERTGSAVHRRDRGDALDDVAAATYRGRPRRAC